MIALETAAQRPTATRRATVLGPEVLALTACVVLLAHCRAPAALLLSGEIASVIGLLGANVVMGRSRYFAAELATVTLAVLLTHYALAPIADVQTPMTSPILLVAVNCLVVHGIAILLWLAVRPFAICRLDWCLLLHFFVLAIAQKDQLGLDFNPYQLGNPLQWVGLMLIVPYRLATHRRVPRSRRNLSTAAQVADGIWLGNERGFEDRSRKPRKAHGS